MRNNGTLLKLLAIGCLAGGLVSCSSPKTQNSENLSQAIDKAQRLCKYAVALMANTYYEYAPPGQTPQAAPLPKPLADGDPRVFLDAAKTAATENKELDKKTEVVKIGELDTVHSRAIVVLKQAETELDKAIADNPQAQETLKSRAKLTKAQILALQAQTYWGQAIAQTNKIGPALEAAQDQLNQARTCAGDISVRGRFAAMGGKEVQQFAQQAGAELTKLEKDAAAKTAQIQDINKQIETLTAQSTQQQTQVTELERNIREAVGKPDLKMCDALKSKSMEMYDNKAKIQDLEKVQRQSLQDDLEVLKGKKAGIEGEVKAAQAAMADNTKLTDAAQKSVAQAQAELKLAREAVLPALTRAYQAYEESQKNAKTALNLLDVAIKKVNEAALSGDASAMAMKGAMGMDVGAINNQLALTVERMKQRRQAVDAVWALKVGDSTLGGETKLPAMLQEDSAPYVKGAVDAFKKAAADYRSATASVPSGAITPANKDAMHQLWVYQACEAGANRALAAVSPEEAASANANADLLEKAARENREFSPYVRDVHAPDKPN